jgi:probable F420-dependent oxidoreductase
MATSMEFYFYCGYVPTEEVVPLIRAADALGYEGVTLPDHVIYAMERTSPYPYSADGSTEWGPDDDWPDPFVIAGAALAATESIKVMTGVLVLALRHPLLAAKALATIDRISPGRVSLGIGAGWMREEFEALNVDFASRGRRTEEAVAVMRTVWGEAPVEHHGEFFNFGPTSSRPFPERPIPIYIGGGSDVAVQRAAALGNGFMPPFVPEKTLAEYVAEVRAIRADLGRQDEPFEFVAPALGFTKVEQLASIAGLGFTAARVHPLAAWSRHSGVHPGTMSARERLTALEWYAAEVLAPARELLGSN